MSEHRAPNGAFRNPWPRSQTPRLREVIRMMREHTSALRAQRGALFLPDRAQPSIVYPRAASDVYLATWIGHSSVLLQIGGLNVLTDPVFSRRASPVPWSGPQRISAPGIALAALPPIDVVLLSHNHYDHLDRAAVQHIAAASPDAHWVVPLGLMRTLKGWGPRTVTELDWGQSTTVKDMTVTATPARHFSGRGVLDRNRTLWCGFAVSVGEWRACFVGDTAYHDGYARVGAECGPFDFLMIPIGAYEPRWFMQAVHVDPEEAVQIYQDLISAHPTHALPLMLGIHWGTFRLTSEPVDEPPQRVSRRWTEVGLPPSRLWTARLGETQRVGSEGDSRR